MTKSEIYRAIINEIDQYSHFDIYDLIVERAVENQSISGQGEARRAILDRLDVADAVNLVDLFLFVPDIKNEPVLAQEGQEGYEIVLCDWIGDAWNHRPNMYIEAMHTILSRPLDVGRLSRIAEFFTAMPEYALDWSVGIESNMLNLLRSRFNEISNTLTTNQKENFEAHFRNAQLEVNRQIYLHMNRLGTSAGISNR